MKRFILLSFVFLGCAFYEFSGGTEFQPEEPARLAKFKAKKAARDDAARKAEIAQKNAAAEKLRATSSIPVGVQLASLDLSDTQSVLKGATGNPNALAPRQTMFSTPSPTPVAELANVKGAVETPVDTVETAKPEGTDLRKVRSARVNMRNGPGTQYNVLGKLKRGDQVAVLQEPGNGWVKLRVMQSGRIGWMSASLLAKVD